MKMTKSQKSSLLYYTISSNQIFVYIIIMTKPYLNVQAQQKQIETLVIQKTNSHHKLEKNNNF